MASGISMADAKAHARREMHRPIKACGFEHREVAGHVVNILFYSCRYEEIGLTYRMQVWVDGMPRAGVIL